MELIIIWTVYFVLVFLALVYAGLIVYHIFKYRYDDLPREQGQYAGKALAIYLGLSGLILLLSIFAALLLILLFRLS
jgi:heme/copper-type cytochrome/quinol oxidase subunit 2